MNAQRAAALNEFLARPPTLETFNKLETQLPFYDMATLAITPELDDSDRRHCVSALEHALALEEVASKFVVVPVIALFDPRASNDGASSTDDTRRQLGLNILHFCKVVANWNGTTQADLMHSLLKDLLVGILQLFAVVGIVRLAIGEGQLSESCVAIERDFVNDVVLPLFDSEETLLSELVGRAILSGADGRVIRIYATSRNVMATWNLPSDGSLESAQQLNRHWRRRRQRLYVTGAEGARSGLESSPSPRGRGPGSSIAGDSPTGASGCEAEDAATLWLFESGLVDAVEERLLGTAKLISSISRPAHVDVVRVRAASLLIRLTDLSCRLARRSQENAWFPVIISELYESEDLLLKLTSTEIVMQEMVHSPSGLKFVFDRGTYKKFMEDLRGPCLDLTMRLALVRVLANMIAKVPQSRFDILNDPTLMNSIADLLSTSVSDKDYDLKRTMAISGVGCIAAKLDVEGMRALTQYIPSWLGEFCKSLRTGSSEHQNLAVLTALLRILEIPGTPLVADSYAETGTSGAGHFRADSAASSARRSPSKEAESQLVTIEEQITPCVLSLLTSKPFAAIHELCFKVVTIFLDRGLRAPLDAFCFRGDLQELLFCPLYTDPPAVKYAKHEFVKAAVSQYKDWIMANTANDKFRDAMVWYGNAAPFEQPPQYKDIGVGVAEETQD